MDPFENHRLSRHVMQTLNTMRENGEFCDLIFDLDNSKISAHRLIVAVWSPPMKNLLRFHSACTQHVRVEYDEPEVFLQFISFLYTGTLAEPVANIPAVLHLATTFQIHLLIELCEEHLKASTSVDNVLSMFQLAHKFHLSDLEAHCFEFLHQNLTKVAQKHELRGLLPAQINFLLQSNQMSSFGLEMKLLLIISWLAEDISYRQQFLIPLLRNIDWSEVRKDFLTDIIQTENFFSSNPSSLYLLLESLHSSSISLEPYESHFWVLQQQYGHQFSSMLVLGTDRPKQVQPLSFSLISSPTEEHIVSGQKNAGHDVGVKKEPQLNMHSGKFETWTCQETTSLETEQTDISASSDLSLLALDSKCRAGEEKICGKSSSQNGGSTSKEEPSCASFQSTSVEGSMRRKCLRPRKIISDSVSIVNKRLKTEKDKRMKNVSKQQNVRGRPKCVAGKNPKCFSEDLQTVEEKSKKDLTQSEMVEDMMVEDGRKKNNRNSRGNKRKHCEEGSLEMEATRDNEADKKDSDQFKKQSMDGKDCVNKEGNLQGRRKNTEMPLLKTNAATGNRDIKMSAKRKIVKVNLKKENKRSRNFTLQIQKCSECEFTTYNRLSLEKHQKQVHEGNCLFCCNLCSFKTKWSKEYYDHMKQSHFPGPPYQCDHEECEYSTEKFQELVSHRKQHSDQRPFVCDICMTAFRSKNNLYQHFKIHSDEKKFECPECGRCFKLKNTLEQHMVTHSDLRPYLCDLCGFSTKFQSHLISHKRIHTGNVFRCSVTACTYSTPKMSQLKSHMRSHLGIRCHVCSTCGKAFVEKSHLVRHERTHSSERPHACKECEYTSTRADKLREHVQKHHSEEGLKAKAAASASKKVETSGKIKTKKDSKANHQCQDEIALLASNPNSLIEVVVMKSTAKDSRPSSSAVVGMVKQGVLASGNVNTRVMQSLHFQPSVLHTGAALANPSLPIANGNITSEFTRTARNDKEMSTVEVLARMSLPITVTESCFRYPVQTNIVGTVGDMTAMTTLNLEPDCMTEDKTSDKISNLYQQQQQTGLTAPAYSMAADTSQFSVTSAPFEQAATASQQNLQMEQSQHHLIMLSGVTSSQQFYQAQQQQHHKQQLDEQHHQENEQLASFPNFGNYLY